ncbi:MAG TPA: 2-C-methyl-D-erythritol 4-phosphate cytidylyltransferase [Puia sp.]|nr:2-C-methyl-D-erythritol 4-phosphate cytidylyltransferase [Puia sp.]
MKKYAVIVAGGSGTRMGTATPKQFLQLHGKPVLWYTLETFLDAYDDLQIVLVLPADGFERGQAVAGMTVASARVRLVEGGGTRYHSVQNGCRAIAAEIGGAEAVIFVHDGVRCLATRGLIHRCYEQALRVGSAVPVINSRDSVRMVTGAGSVAVDRTRIKLVQTPQTFKSRLLLPAYEAEYRESFTDEATVVEAAGGDIHLLEGELNNIKITMPEDLLIAEYLLRPA